MPPSAPSFRDPAGCCCIFNDRVLRFVTTDAISGFETFLQTDCAKKFTTEKKIVPSRKLDENEIVALHETPELEMIFDAQQIGAIFEHEKISFPSYPPEWPPEMLWAAGKWTLEIAQAALADGFCLKDAT